MALTIKQERFAVLWFETGNASEAYRQAYDAANSGMETINNEAYKLTLHPEIAAMVKGLKAKQQAKSVVTVESIARELDELRDVAIANDQAAAGVSAVMGKAKLYGLLVDRQERRDVTPAEDKPSLEKLLAQHKAKQATTDDGTKSVQNPPPVDEKPNEDNGLRH